MSSLITDWIVKVEPNMISKVCAEFTASIIFQFVGSIAPTAWANGIILMVLVYYTAKTSGAHLNPSISLTFCILGYTNPIEMLFYWIAQISGCIVGSLWVALLVPQVHIGMNGFADPHLGCFYPPDTNMTKLTVFGWEAFGTFCFILPIFSMVWYTLHKSGYGNTGPLIVGLSLIGNALAAGPYTGAAFNPARVLGAPAIFKCDNHYIGSYIGGELLAAVLVPVLIAPWYGISNKPWYEKNISNCVLSYFTKVKPARRRYSIDQHALQAIITDLGSVVGDTGEERLNMEATIMMNNSSPLGGRRPTPPLGNLRLSTDQTNQDQISETSSGGRRTNQNSV